MRNVIIFTAFIAQLAITNNLTANPLMPFELNSFDASPPEIGLFFNDEFDISGFRIVTSCGMAIVDSGIIGYYDEVLVLDSSNTSGFQLNPEGDSIIINDNLGYEWASTRFGNLFYAPPPVVDHYVFLRPYNPWQDYVWSFDFSYPGWGESPVIINEIDAHCNWNDNSNFIELYNRADSTINLEGWRIVCDEVCYLSSGDIIQAHGFFILDDPTFPPGFDMDAELDNIYLIDENDHLVDQVGWSSNHGENISFMRFPDGSVDTTYMGRGYRGYNDASSVDFENGFPTRGAPNRHESPGFVVIGTRAVGGEGQINLYWTNPIWDSEFNSVRVMCAEDNFPENADDGRQVYQGTYQQTIDADLIPNQWYYYTIFARNNGGEYSIPTDESRVMIYLGDVVGIEEEPLPERISYLIAYPNPFNPTANIEYGLEVESSITLSIYNIIGQSVAKLFEGRQDAGEHSMTWNASEFPSGIYLARLEAGNKSQNVKMVLLK